MNVGDKRHFKGEEVTITTEPYILYGGEFVDSVTADGKVITLATDNQKTKDAKKAQDVYVVSQKAFSDMKGLKV